MVNYVDRPSHFWIRDLVKVGWTGPDQSLGTTVIQEIDKTCPDRSLCIALLNSVTDDFFDHLTGKIFLSQHDAIRALDPDASQGASNDLPIPVEGEPDKSEEVLSQTLAGLGIEPVIRRRS